jgi:rubredoxin
MNMTTGQIQKGANQTTFYPMGWAATVEKVAVNAVMAGAQPEFMPIILAVASTGGGVPSSNGRWAGWVCVSGPIAKEIGMNAGNGTFNAGNVANMTIGRAHSLMLFNIAGAIQGVNRLDFGSPWNKVGTAFAEDDGSLPAGWLTLREERGYKKTDNVILMQWTSGSVMSTQFAPSSFRGLNAGSGGLARFMGVEGKPGKYNFLPYIIPEFIADRFGPMVHLAHTAVAQTLKDAGFNSKLEVLEFIWKNSFIPMKNFRNYGWYDFMTSGGANREVTSGKPYRDLPDDYMTPVAGDAPGNSVIIVGFDPGDETWVTMRTTGSVGAVTPVDPWK